MNQQENREIRISPDALIALVVAEAEDRELSAMPSLEEMNAAFHPSEEFQKKMDRLLKQAKRKQERKGAWRATKRLFVVATTVVTAFACILMPVQAVQEAVVSTVLNWRDQFVEILYSKEDDPNAVILLQNVELTYLPEGFTETPSNRTSNTSFWNEYQSENGEWLTVRILPIDKAPVMENGLPVTTKADPLAHGYGLQNIVSILADHGACPAILCQDGWFQFSTVLFHQTISPAPEHDQITQKSL